MIQSGRESIETTYILQNNIYIRRVESNLILGGGPNLEQLKNPGWAIHFPVICKLTKLN